MSLNEYEYEVVYRIESRNIIYSVLLSLIAPFISLSLLKNLDYYNSLFQNNIELLAVYLLMLLYWGGNSIRYLKGILIIHHQIKFVGKFYENELEFNLAKNKKIFNYGIIEVIILFFSSSLLINDFHGRFEIITNDIIVPVMDDPSSLENKILIYCIIFSISILFITFIDIFWLKNISKSDYYLKSKCSLNLESYQPNLNGSSKRILNEFIQTCDKQRLTSFIDLGCSALIFGFVLFVKLNIFHQNYLYFICVPIMILFSSIVVEFHSYESIPLEV